MFGLGGQELMLLLGLGVLLFGRNLPSIGRYVGQSIVELKRGLAGIEAVPNMASLPPAAPEPLRPPQRVTSTAPKFTDDGSAPAAV